jgi:Flp pilus assembly pilin Flp
MAHPQAKDNLSAQRKSTMKTILVNIWQDRRGQDMTEYALIGGLMASMTCAMVPELVSISEHISGVLHGVTQAVITMAGIE